jgi:N-methylhydantoinase A
MSAEAGEVRRAGVDVGGTFTDVVTVDPAGGGLLQAKALTTYPDPTPGFLAALAKLGGTRLGYLGYGTTLATNALLTRSGAATALLTTRGFRDVLEIRRTHREKLFDLYEEIPEPLVPRPLRFEVGERVGADGEVVEPLAEGEVREAARRIRAAGVRSVAVCYLFAFRNGDHERRTRELLRQELPELAGDISLSCEVLPLHREYERTSTTVLNAYLTPLVRAYFEQVGEQLRRAGHDGRLQVMQSSGGLVRPDRAARLPILTLLSGPAGGAIAAAYLGRQVGEPRLLTLDMGGTSCDVTGVVDGEPDTRVDFQVGGYAVSYPTIDIHTIGAGGGSIARVDGFGRLSVGPASAGSNPGPACYGLGGEEPTVTDANLVLGIYDPELPLGGEIHPDPELAARAIERHVARPLGLGVLEAAAGVVRLVDASMMHALRTVSVERGRDPRDYALVAFGGAGPVHGAGIAKELGIRRLLVPPIPGCNSALGILASDVRHELVQAHAARLAHADLDRLGGILRGLAAEGDRELDTDQVPPRARRQAASLDLRYLGQAYELTVPLDTLAPTGADLAAAIGRFHRLHAARYGHALDDDLVELVNVRLTAVGSTPKPRLGDRAAKGRPTAAEPRAWRKVRLPHEGTVSLPVFHRDDLPAGAALPAPCIVHQLDATTLVPTGSSARVDRTGTLVVEL